MDIFLVLALGAAFLAFSNGGNDVFKGVATLFGSGIASYRAALTWATVTTAAGAVCAAFLAEGLVRAFSAKGLVPEAVATSQDFLVAVVFGAGATVLLATRHGLPISTTHAIVGALTGAGLASTNGAVDLGILARQFVLPLLSSPVVALALGATVYTVARAARNLLGAGAESCVCVVVPRAPVATSGLPLALRITNCDPSIDPGRTRRFGIRATNVLDVLHFLSAGATSFARGMNDAPKIAGLLVVASADRVGSVWILASIALVMSIGGLLGARRVAKTVAQDITAMNEGQGLAANVSTAAIVLLASRFGLPVSTTHVSCGALFGIGTVTRQANLVVVRKILLAWLFTVPVAAVSATAVTFAIRGLHST